MNSLYLLIPFLLAFPANQYTIEFGKAAGRTSNWVILSDNVMGGVSEAAMEYGNTAVIIKGYVSLQNRGGFVSIKSGWGKMNLAGFKIVKITFRSTSQVYAFTLENSRRWYEPAYKLEFSAGKANTWETVYLKLDDFKEERIGVPTGNKVNGAILESITRIGIVTNEKREGPFQLEIESVEFL
jgi:monofunctional biosynthetic peptidoglycan transglycosylase